jgi:PKD repeat protein
MALATPVFVQTSTFTHAYANQGTYTVTFTVKNATGEQTTSTVTIHISTPAQGVPVVSNFMAVSTKPHQATLTWNTDVKADSSVWFGTTTPVDTSVAANVSRSAKVLNHKIVLTKLEPSTTYYVVVGSADQAGTTMSSETSFITPTVTNNNAPSITGLTGSTTIAVGDVETVTINASDPKNSPLSYSVNWGDNPPIMMAALMASAQPVFNQTSTFTHVYSNPGTYTAQFTVKNEAGLSTSSSLAITVTAGAPAPDITPPVITLNGSSTVNLMVGDTYTELGAVATDNVDGTDPVVISGDVVNTAVASTYIVKYDATDAAGNKAVEVTRTIIVSPSTNPDVTPPVISNVGGTVGSTTATATWTTDEPSTSRVFYSSSGPIDLNDSATPFIFDASLVTDHSLQITGLATSTLYHYVVESADASNNIATSSNATFTTNSQ